MRSYEKSKIFHKKRINSYYCEVKNFTIIKIEIISLLMRHKINTYCVNVIEFLFDT
jgi:hypothetical protein